MSPRILDGCHADGIGTGMSSREIPGRIVVAVAGQPNVGKTTVFNMLTGLNQHVGNWPGKTIAQKTGTFRHNGTVMELTDLPGTYSLTANSEEERIARDYLIRQQPDVVVAIANAAALERSLYLVAELLSLKRPLVVGLNMCDVAEQIGVQVEPHVLAAALGVPVVPLVATRNQGLSELMDEAFLAATQEPPCEPNRPAIRPEHGPVLEAVADLIHGHVPPPYPEDWVALKLLEGDSEITAMIEDALPEEEGHALQALLMQHEDAYLDIAGGRYEWISRMVRAAVIQPKAGIITHTEHIDRVATHPLWGFVLLLAMFGLVFWVTYTIATPIAGWLSSTVLDALDRVSSATLSGAPGWMSSLVSDGLIHGVGTVMTFLPILVIFFAVLGLLEDVGYLSRGAYVMDRFMHLMGLHGKSFLPLFLGFGCNVPAVLGARIIEERRARQLTILLAPLVPCTARLAVVAFLAPAFFGSAAALASWSLVAANLLVLAAAGIAINRLAFHGEHTAFIMELPLYHVPNARTVGLYVWHNTTEFLKKAGTLILIASMVVWALSALPGPTVESSFLASFGRWLEPAGRLIGLGDWRMIMALLTSFFAKENVIATLGILYGSGAGSAALPAQIAVVLAPAARMAFLVAFLLFVPCLATVATIRQETGSWRWTASSMLLLLVLSLGAGMIVYQAGRLVIG
jgi:ferrous iron transport protein B